MATISRIRPDRWADEMDLIAERLRADDVLGVTVIVHRKDTCFRMATCRDNADLCLEMVLGRLRVLEHELIDAANSVA